MQAPPLVIDTNVVLDLWVFRDEAALPLADALSRREWRWMATAEMREELRRVLDYPHLAARITAQGLARDMLMARFDENVELAEVAVKAPYTCKDADDQKFIDLAVAHKAPLLSKDAAVLTMRRRLATLGVPVAPSLAKLQAGLAAGLLQQ